MRLRLRLLFLVVHVYTAVDFSYHRGFGVVPVRGKDLPCHFRPDPKHFGWRRYKSGGGRSDSAGARLTITGCGDAGEDERKGGSSDEEIGRESPSVVHENRRLGRGGALHRTEGCVEGPMQCVTFEVPQCTSLTAMERMVAKAVGAHPDTIRLWVMTQPVTDRPFAPREPLRCVLNRPFSIPPPPFFSFSCNECPIPVRSLPCGCYGEQELRDLGESWFLTVSTQRGHK